MTDGNFLAHVIFIIGFGVLCYFGGYNEGRKKDKLKYKRFHIGH